MKFILTTDNAGGIPEHFRELKIATDEGYLLVARIPATKGGAKPPAVVDAARALVNQANAADVLRKALNDIIEINGCTGGYKALAAEFKHIARTAIAQVEAK